MNNNPAMMLFLITVELPADVLFYQGNRADDACLIKKIKVTWMLMNVIILIRFFGISKNRDRIFLGVLSGWSGQLRQ